MKRVERLSTNKLPILSYHSLDGSGSVLSVEPADFASQIASINARGLRGISLSEAVNHRRETGKWPQRAIVLTFDDGFANFLESALPILEKHSFTATVFVVTGHMGGFTAWTAPSSPLSSIQLLSWQQAAELMEAGIEIGSHTRSHKDLSRCSTQEVDQELLDSQIDIVTHLGVEPTSFAYPYGATPEVAQQIASHRYKAACTTELRAAAEDSLNMLPRIDMYYLRNKRRFEAFLDGDLNRYLTFRRLGRHARRLFFSDSEGDYTAIAQRS